MTLYGFSSKSYTITEYLIQDRMFFGIYKPGGTYTKSQYTPVESKILQTLNEMLSAGGTTTNMPENIQAVKFTKNLWNLSMATMCTLTGYTLPSIFRAPPGEGQSYDPYVSPATKHLIEEYTLSSLEAILREAITVGRWFSRACYFVPIITLWPLFLRPFVGI
jgi:2-dehydropantoate 2-reductase